jgi:hypothetical protein
LVKLAHVGFEEKTEKLNNLMRRGKTTGKVFNYIYLILNTLIINIS